jgi:hypothetical protein
VQQARELLASVYGGSQRVRHARSEGCEGVAGGVGGVIDPRVGCARRVRRPDLLANQSRQSNPELGLVIFATLIIVFLALEPEGLNRL